MSWIKVWTTRRLKTQGRLTTAKRAAGKTFAPGRHFAWGYLMPLPGHSELFVGSGKIIILHVYLAPTLGVTSIWNFTTSLASRVSRMRRCLGYDIWVVWDMIFVTVLTELRLMKDRRTDIGP